MTMGRGTAFDYNDLDQRIRRPVRALHDFGIDTIDSCEGGPGHMRSVPTIRFRGDETVARYAIAALAWWGYACVELRKCWLLFPDTRPGAEWEVIVSLDTQQMRDSLAARDRAEAHHEGMRQDAANAAASEDASDE